MRWTKRPLVERFWPKVQKTDECWLWTAARLTNGYGVIGRGGKRGGSMFAHRASWEIHFGPIPDGLFVCHRCDNRLCVRSEHLFLGTHAENMADMVTKGRVALNPQAGEKNGRAKLTTSQVADIRSRFTSGTRVRPGTGAQLAAEYGVSRALINYIVSGKGWKGVADLST